MAMDEHDDSLDPDLHRVLLDAYRAGMDVEVAARHLWRLHEEAKRAAVSASSDAASDAAASSDQASSSGSGQGEPPGRTRQRAAALLSAVFLFATSGVAVAGSGHALPGELLYPVKRGAERVQLLASWSAAGDAELNLRFARTRLAEAASVGGTRPAWGPRLVAEAVRSADRAEERGGPAVAQEAAKVREEAGQTLIALGSPAPESDVELAQVDAGSAVEGQPEPDAPASKEASEDQASEPKTAATDAADATDTPPTRRTERLVVLAPSERQDAPDRSEPDRPSEPSPAATATAPSQERTASDPAQAPAATKEDPAPAQSEGDAAAGPPPAGDEGADAEADQPSGKHVPSASELAARFDARWQPDEESDP